MSLPSVGASSARVPPRRRLLVATHHGEGRFGGPERQPEECLWVLQTEASS